MYTPLPTLILPAKFTSILPLNPTQQLKNYAAESERYTDYEKIYLDIRWCGCHSDYVVLVIIRVLGDGHTGTCFIILFLKISH